MNKCNYIKTDGSQCKRYSRIDGFCNMHFKKKPKECSICFNVIQKEDLCTLDCNHSFHKICIYKWFIKTNTCPICRQDLNKDIIDLKISRIYNMKKKGRGLQFLISYEGSEERIWIPGKQIQEYFQNNISIKV